MLSFTEVVGTMCSRWMFQQESPADARVTRDTAATYRTLNSAIRSADPENSGLEISNM